MRILISLCFVVNVIHVGVASAVPSAYASRFGSLMIHNTTNSTLLRDSEKSQTVWVLPPSAGVSEFKGFVPSANLGFCSGIRDLMSSTNRIEQRLGALAAKQEELEPEVKRAEGELMAAKKRLGQVAESALAKHLIALEGRVDQLEVERGKILEQMESCASSCDELRVAFGDIRRELREARNELAQLRDDHRQEVRSYERAIASVSAAEEALDTVGARYEKLSAKLSDIHGQVFQIFASKGKLEGGFASIAYDSGWDASIQTLEHDYPQYDFKAIPTSNVHINANIVGAGSEQSYYESLPLLLDYAINGVTYVPWGHTDHEQSSLPSRMGGHMRLSTLGGCPLADKNFFTETGFVPKLGDSDEPLFAISATYQYPVAFKFRVKARYNLYKFYEMIKKKSTRGGLFSTAAYGDVIENKMDRDVFHIDWELEDPESTFDASTRLSITQEIKKNLVERVLQTIAEPVVPSVNQATFLDVGVPPEPQAMVIAKGLSPLCGLNMYCHASSWILRGISGAFGSRHSEQTFETTWNRTAEEIWSSDIATYRSGAVAYTRH